jgi:nitroreductase
MAAMTILLGAVDHGLAACFFGVPTARWPALRAAFGVPPEFDPVGVVSLGFAAPDRRSPSLRRGRKPWVDAVGYGSFG